MINYNGVIVNDRSIGDNGYSRALEVCWLAVIFLIPLFFNPSSHQAFYLNKALLLQFIVIIMLAILFAAFISGKQDVHPSGWRDVVTSPLTITILVFGLITIVATIVSITPSISFWGSYFRKEGLVNLICWIVFFIIVGYNLRNRAQLFRAIYTLLFSSALVSVLGILTSFFPELLLGYGHGNYRVSATIGNALSLSNYLAMIIPINMAFITWLWMGGEKKNYFILCCLLILLILQFWCLWLAQYSITILLYIIAPLIFILLVGIIRHSKFITGFGAGLIMIVVIIAVIILMPLFLNGRNAGSEDYKDTDNFISAENLELDTVGRRIIHWGNTVDLIMESPKIPFSNDRLSSLRTFIGYGPETFIVTYQRYYPEDLDDYQSFFLPPLSRPHNHYLYLAATIGLIGLASFLSIIIIFIWIPYRDIRKAGPLINRLLLIAMIAGIIQYSADSIFNPSTIASELVLWLDLSLIFALSGPGFDDDSNKMEAAIKRFNDNNNSNANKHARIRSYISAGCAALVMIIGINMVIRPFIADIQFQRGIELQAIRDEGALTAYEKAVDLEPKEAVYWSNLGTYNYSRVLQTASGQSKEKLLEFSTDAYEQALMKERYISYRYYPMADVYTYWAKEGASDKWPRAMLLYDRASQLSPRNMIILNKWAHALIVKGDLEQAQAKLDEAKSMNSYWIGNALISALVLIEYGRNEEAVDEIIASIEESPDGLHYSEAIFYEMAVYKTIGTIHKALDSYTQVSPDEWIHHAMLGFTSLFVNEPDKSIAEFDTAMHLVPDEYAGDLFTSIISFTRKVPYISLRLPEAASKWRQKLLQTDDSDEMIRMLDNFLN